MDGYRLVVKRTEELWIVILRHFKRLIWILYDPITMATFQYERYIVFISVSFRKDNFLIFLQMCNSTSTYIVNRLFRRT